MFLHIRIPIKKIYLGGQRGVFLKVVLGFRSFNFMTSDESDGMFEGDSADKCGGKIPLVSMGG
jgi:hypothetical protein